MIEMIEVKLITGLLPAEARLFLYWIILQSYIYIYVTITGKVF